jgi:threonine dehydrogenase-like Zn-dependent dehydrogenase
MKPGHEAMKAAAIFPAQKRLELIDHPKPKSPRPGEALLRVLDVGICGTDREIATFEYGVPPDGEEYLVLGHECLAEVVEANRCTVLAPGDLAIPTVRRPCDLACAPCTAGRQDFCETGRYRERGIVRTHGFLTEFVVESETNLNPVSPAIREFAVLAEPLTVTEKAWDQLQVIAERMPRSAWKDRRLTAVILGAGPVGLLAAMKFQLASYEVFVYSRGSEREKPPLVNAIGATFVDSEANAPGSLRDICGGRIDVIYEAMGAPDLVFDVLGQLSPNGIFVFTGIPRHTNPIPIDTSALLYRLVLQNQVIFGTVNSTAANFRSAISDVTAFHDAFPGVVPQLITQRLPIEQFTGAIYEPAGIKTVIRP